MMVLAGTVHVSNIFRNRSLRLASALKKGPIFMRKFLIALLCIGSLGAGSTAVEAKGCIKGALVGGVAGHYAGHHAILGAAAGCLAGRHMAKQRAAAPAPSGDGVAPK